MQRRMRKGIRVTTLGKRGSGLAVCHPSGATREHGARAGPTREGEAPPAWILDVACAVRRVLLQDFPERRKLELQCQRASAILAAVLRKRRIDVRVISGHVRGNRKEPDTDTGHIWCRILHPEEGCWYLLDVALAQFDYLFDRTVPDIVWGKYWNCLREYGYVEDDPPEWSYDPRDFDPRRVEAVRSLVG